jgi:tetratricopeptide (TPR) repeat protein
MKMILTFIIALFASSCALPPSLKGDLYISHGEYEKAIDEYKKADRMDYIHENPRSLFSVYNNWAAAYARTNKLERAYQYFLKAAEVLPTKAYYPYVGLAEIEHLRGNLEQAVKYIEKAYKLVYLEEYYEYEGGWNSAYSTLTLQKRVTAYYDYLNLAIKFSKLKRFYEQKKYQDVDLLASEILNKKYHIELGIEHFDNIVHKVKKGSVADINGIVTGDKILEIDEKGIMDTISMFNQVSLTNALSNLYDNFGKKVNIKLLRKGRAINIVCYLYYPELETARQMQSEAKKALLSGDSRKYAKDIDSPRLVILKPNTQGGERIVSQESIEIVVLASDNFGVEKVMANEAVFKPTPASFSEKSLLDGDVKKYTARLTLRQGKNPYVVTATDTSGNKTRMKISVSYNPQHKQQEALYGRSIAVVIGINNYATWPSLDFAVNDAKAVKKKLYNVGFDKVITLYDQAATRLQILKLLSDRLPNILQENDRLMIFFAGHGQTETFKFEDESGHIINEKEGYLIAVDSDLKNYSGTAISMTKIREIAKKYKAKHILFAFDSCYSGLGLKRSGGIKKVDGFIKKLASMKAVQILTAGGENEQVGEEKGHGIFTRHLLLSLSGKADLDSDGFITASEIGTYIRPTVSRKTQNSQTPKFGWISGEGDFIFDNPY